jgi:hypothetical protein
MKLSEDKHISYSHNSIKWMCFQVLKGKSAVVSQKKLRGWGWRHVTALKFIDRDMDARTYRPLYHNYSWNHVLRVYSVCLHLLCLHTLELNKLIFWSLIGYDNWSKLMRNLNVVFQESNGYILISPEMDVGSSNCSNFVNSFSYITCK